MQVPDHYCCALGSVLAVEPGSRADAAPSEARRIFNETRAKRVKRVKIIEWVSLVVDVVMNVCSNFAGFIASMLVFIKAR